MKRRDSDDSPVAAKLQRFDLSGKALYKKTKIIIIIYYSYIVRAFSSSTRNFIGLLVKFIQDALCIIRQYRCMARL